MGRVRLAERLSHLPVTCRPSLSVSQPRPPPPAPLLDRSRPVGPSWALRSTSHRLLILLSVALHVPELSLQATNRTRFFSFLMSSFTFSSTFSFSLLLSLAFLSPSLAQSPSTNLPVPPLQWIDLSPRITGSGPPAVRDASIGFDESIRPLIVFGGEVNGIPGQQTFL